jgi:hypothetical protein
MIVTEHEPSRKPLLAYSPFSGHLGIEVPQQRHLDDLACM